MILLVPNEEIQVRADRRVDDEPFPLLRLRLDDVDVGAADLPDFQVEQVGHAQAAVDAEREEDIVPEVPDLEILPDGLDHLRITDRLDEVHGPPPHTKIGKKKHLFKVLE